MNAVEIDSGIDGVEHGAQRRSWWNDGDEVGSWNVLAFMGPDERDLHRNRILVERESRSSWRRGAMVLAGTEYEVDL
jgi:hypothetical protein